VRRIVRLPEACRNQPKHFIEIDSFFSPGDGEWGPSPQPYHRCRFKALVASQLISTARSDQMLRSRPRELLLRRQRTRGPSKGAGDSSESALLFAPLQSITLFGAPYQWRGRRAGRLDQARLRDSGAVTRRERTKAWRTYVGRSARNASAFEARLGLQGRVPTDECLDILIVANRPTGWAG
jgi:hypothetical protein